jgi:hypothetical protein
MIKDRTGEWIEDWKVPNWPLGQIWPNTVATTTHYFLSGFGFFLIKLLHLGKRDFLCLKDEVGNQSLSLECIPNPNGVLILLLENRSCPSQVIM